jgi:hypothetical protein
VVAAVVIVTMLLERVSPLPQTMADRRATAATIAVGTLLFGVAVAVFPVVWYLYWPRSLDAVHSAAVAAVVIVTMLLERFWPGFSASAGFSVSAAPAAIFAIMCHLVWPDSIGYYFSMSAAAAATAATAGVLVVIFAASAVAVIAADVIGMIVRPTLTSPFKDAIKGKMESVKKVQALHPTSLWL